MKSLRTLAIGKGPSPFALTRKRRHTDKTYGLGIWIIVLMAIIGIVLIRHQNNLTPTPAQETAFRQEQAKRLAALGMGPVVQEGGPAYAEKH